MLVVTILSQQYLLLLIVSLLHYPSFTAYQPPLKYWVFSHWPSPVTVDQRQRKLYRSHVHQTENPNPQRRPTPHPEASLPHARTATCNCW